VSGRPRRPAWVRLVGGLTAARLGWGAALVLAPGPMVRTLGGAETPRSRRVARVLGVRHLIQGLWERTSAPGRLRLGSLVDASHALSAVALAVLDRRWRRAALADAALAMAFGLGGIQLARSRRSEATRRAARR
jgi:hypothetical protein